MKSPDLWTEHLLEKHECGPYPPDRTKRWGLELQGTSVTLVVPEWLPDVEPVALAVRDDLLFVIGKIRAPKDWGIAATARCWWRADEVTGRMACTYGTRSKNGRWAI